MQRRIFINSLNFLVRVHIVAQPEAHLEYSTSAYRWKVKTAELSLCLTKYCDIKTHAMLN